MKYKSKKMGIQRNNKTIVLKIFNTSLEAGIAKSKLQAKGIESFLENENVVGLNPLGGIELKVFSKDLERAKKILSQ